MRLKSSLPVRNLNGGGSQREGEPETAHGEGRGGLVRSYTPLWTRDVITMMAVVILSFSGLLTLASLANIFTFQEILPIYVLLAVISIAYLATRRGGWRVTRFLPVGLAFGLGVYGTYGIGFTTVFILFFALAVMLAGMLLGNRWRQFTAAAAIISYIVLGFAVKGVSLDWLPQIIIFSSVIVGTGLLQRYSVSQIINALEQQIDVNHRFQAELFRREETEMALRRSETLLRRLTDNMSDLVVEMDVDGTLTYVSPSHLTGLGFLPEDLLETNGFDLVHPDDRPLAVEASMRAVASRATERVQLRIRHANGDYLVFELSGRAIFSEDGQLAGFVISSRDITEQKKAEFALRESERRFGQVIEALPLGVITFKLDGENKLVIQGCNPAAESVLGSRCAALADTSLEEFLRGFSDPSLAETFYRVAGGGQPVRWERLDYQNGQMPVILRMNAFRTPLDHLVIAFEDETKHVQAAEALRSSEEKFATAFITSPDAININRLSDGLFLDVNQGFTRLVGYSREEVIGKTSLELNIWANLNDRALMIQGLKERGEVQNLEARFRLKNGDVRIGLMSARVINIDGEVCILSITRDIQDWIQAEEQLRQSHYDLERAYEATLEGWTQALEMRERETAGHSRNVVGLTLEIARGLGFDGVNLAHLRRGALLHDIGKLSVPDKILLKPEPLSAEEWAIMRQHPDYARKLLSGIDYLQPSLPIPYSHHEKWDGSGYPLGLQGEQIPLAARIFAVVDVFDALTSDRPYRPKWTTADALEYIRGQRGKHFDPYIVDVFLMHFQ